MQKGLWSPMHWVYSVGPFSQPNKRFGINHCCHSACQAEHISSEAAVVLATFRSSESSFCSSSSSALNDGRQWWSKDLQNGQSSLLSTNNALSAVSYTQVKNGIKK